jgi:nitrite reductase/ring-hydroxylating ferredoxin subunit
MNMNAYESIERSVSMKLELCKVADVPSTGTLIAPFFGRELHVYRTGDRVRAVANICLHFGGPLECKDGKFVCSWHNASFDMATGHRIDGPAATGAKLMTLPTRVDGDALFYVWGEQP